MGKFDGVLIVSDIDGTLTDDKQMLSAENKNAIEYFKSEGGIFTIATGRLPDYFREKGFDKLINCPAVLLNGAAVYDFECDEFMLLKKLPNDFKKVYNKILKTSGAKHINFNYEDSGIADENISIEKAENPCKIVTVASDEASAINLRRILSLDFGDDFEIFRSWNTGVEVLRKGATKGDALEFLRKKLSGITITAAIGDYENDISLIEHADISFVPENAVTELKEKADYVVSHHNNNAIKDMIEILKGRV